MEVNFARILKLVKRTGDRVIITDSAMQQAFVVMDLDQYESLLDLSVEQEVLFNESETGFTEEDFDLSHIEEEINQTPIEVKKNESLLQTHEKPSIWQVMTESNDNKVDTWNLEKLPPEEKATLEKAFRIYQEREGGHSPPNKDNRESDFLGENHNLPQEVERNHLNEPVSIKNHDKQVMSPTNSPINDFRKSMSEGIEESFYLESIE